MKCIYLPVTSLHNSIMSFQSIPPFFSILILIFSSHLFMIGCQLLDTLLVIIGVLQALYIYWQSLRLIYLFAMEASVLVGIKMNW